MTTGIKPTYDTLSRHCGSRDFPPIYERASVLFKQIYTPQTPGHRRSVDPMSKRIEPKTPSGTLGLGSFILFTGATAPNSVCNWREKAFTVTVLKTAVRTCTTLTPIPL